MCAVALVIASIGGCGGRSDEATLVSASKCLVRTDGATQTSGLPFTRL
jgi:hypothetical protein